jgi:hypothetical protein
MQSRLEFLGREEVAAEWFREDYEPIVAAMRQVGLIGDRTETEAYMRLVSERYLLLRTHAWDEEVRARLGEKLGVRKPG